MMATMSDAHREWHLNSGVPMGQPGCPQDACHPPEDSEPPTVKCGNKGAHGGEPGYHYSAAEVRECYGSTGRFSGSQMAESSQKVVEADRGLGIWHSTGPAVEQGHWKAECPGASCPVTSLPSVTVEDTVSRMRASIERAEAEKREAARQRYAAWRTIPVGSGDYANYALETSEGVVLYQVQRPSEGRYAGKTYVKRHSGDGLVKMGWVETGATLDAIAADPMAAAVLYGRSAKRCAICHRQLTDDKHVGPDGLTSLQRGIGPKCAQRVG